MRPSMNRSMVDRMGVSIKHSSGRAQTLFSQKSGRNSSFLLNELYHPSIADTGTSCSFIPGIVVANDAT